LIVTQLDQGRRQPVPVGDAFQLADRILQLSALEFCLNQSRKGFALPGWRVQGQRRQAGQDEGVLARFAGNRIDLRHRRDGGEQHEC